jgi:membrane protein DedA with SNARE-associated domain
MLNTRQILDLIHAYSEFVGPLSFLIALLGSLLVTNLFVPAGSFLTAMGVLVGAGIISWTIVVWAAVGAMVGCSTSYTAGSRFGTSVRGLRVLQRWPGLMDRAQALFLQYGLASVLIGYFSGPLRAPIASMAAIACMGRAKFELANLVSAFVWAAFAVGVGAAPGVLIATDSPWLLVAPFLAPVITIGISASILLFRKSISPSR